MLWVLVNYVAILAASLICVFAWMTAPMSAGGLGFAALLALGLIIAASLSISFAKRRSGSAEVDGHIRNQEMILIAFIVAGLASSFQLLLFDERLHLPLDTNLIFSTVTLLFEGIAATILLWGTVRCVRSLLVGKKSG